MLPGYITLTRGADIDTHDQRTHPCRWRPICGGKGKTYPFGVHRPMLFIRGERPEDIAAIHEVHELAFGRPTEADLVDTLCACGMATLSLVAVEDDRIVGHILFSPVTIESGDRTFRAAGLAPMAVLPERQRQGIGSQWSRLAWPSAETPAMTAWWFWGTRHTIHALGLSPQAGMASRANMRFRTRRS